eukprot:scaffold7339_cov249-Pinguiococcus_pyrenoidosus.AAC.8
MSSRRPLNSSTKVTTEMKPRTVISSNTDAMMGSVTSVVLAWIASLSRSNRIVNSRINVTRHSTAVVKLIQLGSAW